MKASVLKIVIGVAFIVLGFSIPARADVGLCNHFMALVARARGDATEEFKRRVAFLLETGKIGEAELDRMIASEIAAGPFPTGQHLSADLIPHQGPFARLLGDTSLDWKEVRRFVEELRTGVKRSEEESEVHERETESVLYPHRTVKVDVDGDIKAAASVLEVRGKTYVAVGKKSGGIRVMEGPSGKVVLEVETGSLDSGLAVLFNQGERPYLAVATDCPEELHVYDLKAKKRVVRVKTGCVGPQGPVVFTEGGKSYLALGSVPGQQSDPLNQTSGFYVYEALTGKRVAKMDIAAWPPKSPSIIRHGDKNYLIGAATGRLIVAEATSGNIVTDFELSPYAKVPPNVLFPPTAFEHQGTLYVAVASDRDSRVRVVEGLTGRLVSTVDADISVSSSPVFFEQDGKGYVVVGQNSGSVYVADILTGRVIRRIDLRSLCTDGPPGVTASVVVKQDGNPFVVTALHNSGKGGGLCIAEALKDTPVQMLQVSGDIYFPPAVFDHQGGSYYFVVSSDGHLYVGDVFAPTSPIIVSSGLGISSPLVIFKKDGGIYAAAGLDNKGFAMFQLFGPLSKEKKGE